MTHTEIELKAKEAIAKSSAGIINWKEEAIIKAWDILRYVQTGRYQSIDSYKKNVNRAYSIVKRIGTISRPTQDELEFAYDIFFDFNRDSISKVYNALNILNTIK